MFTQGKRLNHPLIRMVICDCVSEGDPARVAFAAAKRLGNAVVRNRSKRVLREAARDHLVRHPAYAHGVSRGYASCIAVAAPPRAREHVRA